MSFALDVGELVKRALKYFVEGVIVALAAFVIPSKKLRIDETLCTGCGICVKIDIRDSIKIINLPDDKKKETHI